MIIHIERNLLPDDWPTPLWAKFEEAYEVPTWLVRWAKNPCDMLFRGYSEHISTLAYLLLYFSPNICLQRVEVEELNPIKDPETDREYRLLWGGKYPTLSDVLFITDVVGTTNDWLQKQIKKVVKARRSARKLTIIHFLDNITSWEALRIDIPLLLEVE